MVVKTPKSKSSPITPLQLTVKNEQAGLVDTNDENYNDLPVGTIEEPTQHDVSTSSEMPFSSVLSTGWFVFCGLSTVGSVKIFISFPPHQHR